jgi:phosphatidylglycerophosphate synthase
MDAVSIKRSLQKRLAKRLEHVAISPNTITVSSLLAMLIAGGFVLIDNLIGAGVFILVSGAMDFLDGAVAKASGRVTQFGGLLDRVTDRANDFVVIASLIVSGAADLSLGMTALLTIFLASYISACLEAAQGSSIGETLSLRAVRITLLALACFFGQINPVLLLLAAVGTYSVAKRLFVAYCLLR